MPLYYYEARDAIGREVSGEIEGPGHLDVALELKKLGYQVKGLWQVPPRVPFTVSFRRLFQSVPRKDLALFTRQLAMLLASGVPILEGLEGMQKQELSQKLKEAVGDLCEGLRKGHGLSGSLAARPDVFGDVYVNMVKAGEMSGRLHEILNRLADFMERDYMLVRRIQSAMMYPVLIFVVSVLVVAFMVLFIFPTFISFFKGLNLELPLVTQSLLFLTTALRDPVVLTLLAIAIPLVGYNIHHHLSHTASGNRLWASFLLALPLVGPVQRDVILARFCRTLGTLMDSGVPQMLSLELTGGSIGNYCVQSELQQASHKVRDEGLSLARALASMRFFPKMCVNLMMVGEEAGKLPLILNSLADSYDLDVKTSVTRFTVVLEPLMLAVMGFIVGYVLLAVFLPVYSLLEAL